MKHFTDTDDPSKFARDAFGMVLGYHDADFNRTGSPFNPSNSKLISSVSSSAGNPGVNLYNGNISSWTIITDTISANTAGFMGFKYRYDQLNRIKTEDYNYFASSTWNTTNDFDNNYNFDGNGNITNMKRQGVSNTMDELTAHHISGTNKLDYVDDASASGLYATDIDDQSTGNYLYTAIGERAKDVEGGIDTITWTMRGKIKSIKKTNGDSLAFTYDAQNKRVMKYVKPNGSNPTVTYFVNDANGKLISNYTRTTSGSNYVYTQTEVPIYGRKRIGVYKPNITVRTVPTTGFCISCPVNWYTFDTDKQNGKYTRVLTKKIYELNDHLGNVHVTVKDRKLGVGQTDLLSYTNYYAYGTPLTGKCLNLGDYFAGYNGKYDDTEVFGSPKLWYDYGERSLDLRGVPLFPSPDPLIIYRKKYPELSPYQYGSNRPIDGIDLDGLEYAPADYSQNSWLLLKPELKVAHAQYVAQQVTDKIFNENLKLDHQVYQGVGSAPIFYGGVGGGILGITTPEHSINLYEGSFSSPNNAASTVMHEFNGHYMEQELDLIPNTGQEIRIAEEPNPFLGDKDDPYRGIKTIQVMEIISPLSTIKEEINSYGLQKELHDKSILPIPDKIKSVEGNLKEHKEALDERTKDK